MIETRDKKSFARMLNKALEVRGMSQDSLVEDTGLSPHKVWNWSKHHWIEEPTAKEIALLSQGLGIPESDIVLWLSMDLASFDEQHWLMAAVMIPGLNQDAWMNMEIPDEQSEEEDQVANITAVEDALIMLLSKCPSKLLIKKAQELHSQTKAGREEQAVLANAASEERWERATEKTSTGNGGIRYTPAQKAALRELGF